MSNKNAASDVKRHLADFHPTVWGDHFINHYLNSNKVALWTDRAKILKEEVRKIILSCDDTSQVLNLIDVIQRLGIGYHFKGETEQHLKKILKDYEHSGLFIDVEDLHTIALGFRLLRQQGYYVSPDVFNKFKDSKGGYGPSDVQGLLSLYETSYLRINGEDTLDEALEFAATQLKLIAQNSTSPFLDRIAHALKYPIRRNIEREETRYFISVYEKDEGHLQPILQLGKLEFNKTQCMHLKELTSITKWWRDSGFPTKLPFVRDRVVECFTWPIGVFSEPKYEMGRKMFAKAVALFSVIDDIYDAYGTLEELKLFTNVVESFDISKKDELPEYMQFAFQALYDVYAEYEEFGNETSMFYIKEFTKKLLRAYLLEARWLNNNYVPTVEEYVENGFVTSVSSLFTTICFIGMGELASKMAFDWIATEPKILRGAAIVGRFMDDLASHKFEQKRGHVASIVECYMKQYSVSEEEARYEINKLVENAWKDINEEIVKPSDDASSIPVPLRNVMLSLAKIIYLVYRDGDDYTHSKSSNLRQVLTTFLLEPLSI